jgi:hypothetical protein
MSLESNMDDKNHINFDAPATLRKWPSIKNQRASATDRPYLIVDGTLDDCIYGSSWRSPWVRIICTRFILLRREN